jgi:hypothetical protein
MNRENSYMSLDLENILAKDDLRMSNIRFIWDALMNGGYATALATTPEGEFTTEKIVATGSFILLTNAILLGGAIKKRVESKRKLVFSKALRLVLDEYPNACIYGMGLDFNHHISEYSRVYAKRIKRKSSKEAIDELGIVSYNGEE